MLDKHFHALDGVHVAAGVNVYRTRTFLRESMNADVRLSKRVNNRDALRVKLMRETVEDRGSAHFDGSFKGRLDSCKIIQQMERDAIQAYKNVMSQFA